MCGVTGLIDLSGQHIKVSTIVKMIDAIKHRGPDREGYWLHKNVGIGHTRLSIIDISEAASQPMLSGNDNFVLSYNGEIYNYKEIRSELESLGIQFNTQSDSEVLLKALIFWREKSLIKLNGMFAFAFYDKKQESLLIARDRYGIKPLYYSLQNHFFSFASEQKAIKARVGYKSNFDKEGLYEYLTFQNFFTSKTLESDIKLLPAGHFIHINSKTSFVSKPIQYWDFHFSQPRTPAAEQEYLEELDRLFTQSVKRSLVSDVEIGAYLSGGMDSGSIATLAARELTKLKTFTVGFDLASASGIELGFDEREKARAISNLIQSEHYEFVLKAGDMEKSLPTLVRHLEEPRVGQSYPNLFAAELASRQVKVVLSGSGGDELFGGYPWRYFQAAYSQNFESFIDEYYLYWQRLLSFAELKALLKPIWQDVSHINPFEIFQNVFSSHQNSLESPQDYINHSFYFEAKTFLHGLFVVEDKLGMAYGLETRLPFMDNDLVEFAMSLPVELKVRNLKQRLIVDENSIGKKKHLNYGLSTEGKYLLRKCMEKYISKEISVAPKQGFSSPDASWFRGPSLDFVKRTALNKSNPLYDLISFEATKNLMKDHFEGRKNRRLFIWSILHLTESIQQA